MYTVPSASILADHISNKTLYNHNCSFTLIAEHPREAAQDRGRTKHQTLVRFHSQVAASGIADHWCSYGSLLKQLVKLLNATNSICCGAEGLKISLSKRALRYHHLLCREQEDVDDDKKNDGMAPIAYKCSAQTTEYDVDCNADGEQHAGRIDIHPS